jgi:hypothetical protein
MFGTQGVLAFSKVPALGNVGGMMKKATFCCMYLLDPLLIWVVQFEGWNRSSWSKGALMLRMSLCCCSARKWSLCGILVKIIQKYFHLSLISECNLKCSWKILVSSERVQLNSSFWGKKLSQICNVFNIQHFLNSFCPFRLYLIENHFLGDIWHYQP